MLIIRGLLNLNIIRILDIIIFGFVFIYIIVDLYNIFIGVIGSIFNLIDGADMNVLLMVNGSEGSSSSNVTTTINIERDSSLRDNIRSIFIYGTGGYRLYSLKYGNFGGRFLTMGAVIATDCIATILSLGEAKYWRS